MIRTSNYFYYDKETYSLVKYRHNTVANGPWSFQTKHLSAHIYVN